MALNENDRRLLQYLEDNRAETDGLYVSGTASDFAEHIEVNPMVIGKSARKLQELKLIKLRTRRKQITGMCILGKGRVVVRSKAPQPSPQSSYPGQPESTEDYEAWHKRRAEESQLQRITDLVKPRPWQTPYDAVKELYDFAKKAAEDKA